jgi:hypothetical protein
MKNVFHKIVAIFFAQILLFSTTSFSINKHFCSDSIYSVSVLGEAEDCGMEMKSCENEESGLCSFSNESCCHDVNTVVEGKTIVKTNELQIDVNTFFLTAFAITYQNLHQSNTKTSKRYNNYISPLINKDINVLYEVFLI